MNLKIYAISLLLLCHLLNPANAQQLTRSEALLSGLEEIPVVHWSNPKLPDSFWPDEIDIPKGWRDGFKELIRLTKETGQEHGACLSVIQKGAVPEAQIALLLEYEKLMGLRASISASAFEQQASQIRAQIEKLSAPKSAQQLEWVVGAHQKGNETSMQLRFNIESCGSSKAGDVHTHPRDVKGAATPSSRDFVGLLARHNFASQQQSEFTISNNGEICLLIAPKKTREGSRYDQHELFRTYFTEYLATSFFHYKAGNKHGATRDEQVFTHDRNVAVAIGKQFNAAIYCGIVNEKLKRVKPADDSINENKEASTLALKAAIIAKYYALNKKMPAVNFDFTPDFDAGLVDYLETQSLKKYRAEGHSDFLKIVREKDSKTLLSLEVQGSTEDFFEPSGIFTSPKASRQGLDSANQKYIDYGISLNSSGSLVLVLSIKRRDPTRALQGVTLATDLKTIAIWSEQDGSSLIVDPDTGIGTEYYPPTKRRGKGQYTWIDTVAVRNGEFEYETPDSKTVGIMKDGRFVGQVRQLDKKTGQWSTGVANSK